MESVKIKLNNKDIAMQNYNAVKSIFYKDGVLSSQTFEIGKWVGNYFWGPSHKFNRQDLITLLTGNKMPLSKCGASHLVKAILNANTGKVNKPTTKD